MHQAHNIPWQIIEDNFKFVHPDKSVTPWRTGLTTKGRENMPKALKHFIRKMVEAIKIFSSTEREKYPKIFELPLTGKLFSDALLNRYPEYLNEWNQRIENWIAAAAGHVGLYGDGEVWWGDSRGYFGDVVKILLQENQLSTLLMLAQHPDIPLHSLHLISSQSHPHFGFTRIKDSALRMYIYINAAEATGTLYTGQYAASEEFVSILDDVATYTRYSAHQLPHRQFLAECGVSYGGRSPNSETDIASLYIHQDEVRLKEYLKTLFALMYRYDVLARECGLEPEWEQETVWCSPLKGYIELEHKWVEEEKKWVSYLP